MEEDDEDLSDSEAIFMNEMINITGSMMGAIQIIECIDYQIEQDIATGDVECLLDKLSTGLLSELDIPEDLFAWRAEKLISLYLRDHPGSHLVGFSETPT